MGSCHAWVHQSTCLWVNVFRVPNIFKLDLPNCSTKTFCFSKHFQQLFPVLGQSHLAQGSSQAKVVFHLGNLRSISEKNWNAHFSHACSRVHKGLQILAASTCSISSMRNVDKKRRTHSLRPKSIGSHWRGKSGLRKAASAPVMNYHTIMLQIVWSALICVTNDETLRAAETGHIPIGDCEDVLIKMWKEAFQGGWQLYIKKLQR